MPDPTRAAIYGRISKREEKSILDNMMADARAHAAKCGYVVTREYIDIESGASDKLPGLTKMQHDATVSHWDVLIFKAPSRLTRKGVESAFYLLRTLSENGKSWHCLEYPVISSDQNTPKVVRDVMLSMLAAFDEDYRRNISIHTRDALAKAKSQGIRLGRHDKGCMCPRHRKETLALLEQIRELRENRAMSWEQVGEQLHMLPKNVEKLYAGTRELAQDETA